MKFSAYTFCTLLVSLVTVALLGAARETALEKKHQRESRSLQAQLDHERQYTARLRQILSERESRQQLTPAHASHE